MPKVEMPDKLSFLFRPGRYKVARGGRGSAKSWSFARALLILGIQNKLRVLCAREIQTSIRQSVHRLLQDQINLLKLDHLYDVFDQEIRGKNGTLFSFTGLSTLTVATIKSFEGYDMCWVEEGQVISKRSWDILIPTIRKDASEIWISYNPELETDETHQRFTISPPHGCVNVEINWRDNPWFSEVLEAERQHCKINNPDDYDNIWEGKCRPAVEGAIYFKQIQEAETNRRICNVPHDPMLKTHLVLDLGWEDSLAIGLVQKHVSEIRIIEYLEVSHTSLDTLSAELRTRPYQWGKVWLPHDGYAKSLNSGGKSTADIMESLGWEVAARNEIAEMSVEEGIRQARMTFARMYFDKEKCHALKAPESIEHIKHTKLSHRLIECLKRYRRHINIKTETTSVPVKDIHAHGADCLRYIAINSDRMDNEDTQQFSMPSSNRAIRSNQSGWMQA
jgi:phage terminase large subunit